MLSRVIPKQVIFSEVGDLLRYSLHYDMSGRSKVGKAIENNFSSRYAETSMFKKELVRGKGPWQRSRIGQGPQPGRHHVEKLTAEALDSDLDRYHLEATKLK
ncbi:hypothetical protein POTOM_031089 [Populus tomentosa]|uniref:Uncharacterized protein n=1 Tax=Populus tomentosa TaxID=118781 RepID=A0A8X7Z1Z0_POPTO|nr:hypothetical protein POTOM_031089 [Populus tomentosa]